MDLGAVLLIFSVLILVVIFVSRPLLLAQEDQAEASYSPDQDHQRSELLADYERAISALQELDFDHALGKIPEDEYPDQRAELLASGAEALKKLDALKAEAPTADIEARMEAAIAARRADMAVAGSQVGKLSPSPAAAGEDPIEALVSARRRNRQEKSGGFCPRCGRPVLISDRFCPHCGMPQGK